MSTTAPKRPKRASRARSRASSIRATPTRPSTCSRSACARWKAPRTRAPRRPAWPRSRRRSCARSRAGDHIVAARALFGSCRWVIETLAPKYGIETTLVDGTKIENWEKAVRPNTKLFFLESPTNPTLEVIDIAAVAALANVDRRAAGRRQCLRHAAAAEAAASSARISSSIPRPSISTARAAASAASSCPTRNGSTRTCTTISATPARACRRSTPGRCSRGWRRCRCACASRPRAPARSPTSWPSGRRSPV